MFYIHPQLEKDTFLLGRFPLSIALLMNDMNWPWIVLVPEREGAREIYDMYESDQVQLLRESASLARAMALGFAAEKMNIAMLGNVVPQLHVHHIVRHNNDPAWPAPVWGKLPARPYSPAERDAMINKLKSLGIKGLKFAAG